MVQQKGAPMLASSAHLLKFVRGGGSRFLTNGVPLKDRTNSTTNKLL